MHPCNARHGSPLNPSNDMTPSLRAPSAQEEAIEDEINDGQLEEMLVDGINELKLIDKYAEWRLWEAVDELNKERQET